MLTNTKAADVASVKVNKSQANAASKFDMTKALANNNKLSYGGIRKNFSDTTISNSEIETEEEGEQIKSKKNID